MLQHETLGTRNSCLLEARGSVFQKQAPVQSCAGSLVHLWLHNAAWTQGLAGGYVLHHCWSSMSGPRSVHRGQRLSTFETLHPHPSPSERLLSPA